VVGVGGGLRRIERGREGDRPDGDRATEGVVARRGRVGRCRAEQDQSDGDRRGPDAVAQSVGSQGFPSVSMRRLTNRLFELSAWLHQLQIPMPSKRTAYRAGATKSQVAA